MNNIQNFYANSDAAQAYTSLNSDVYHQIMLLLFSLIWVFILVSLAFFILNGIGLKKMAEKDGISNGILAFVPLARIYIMGKIAFKSDYKALGYMALGFLFFCSAPLPMLENIVFSSIYWIIFAVDLYFDCYVHYKIYKKFSKKAVSMLVFTILSCGLLSPIFFFAIRNNEPRETV